MIELKNIHYSIKGKNILSNINLKIEKGIIVGLLGPNGAGKTTLMKILLGLLYPQEGKVYFEGKRLVEETRVGILRDMGSLIEEASLYKHLTAFENIEQARRIYGTAKSETFRLLEIVGLKEVSHQKIKTFSMGMKQRLGIALAMIGKPKFVILDEPMNGLAPEGVVNFRELVLELNKNEEVTFLISSHRTSEISKLAQHLIVLEQGKIIEDNPQLSGDLNLENYYLDLLAQKS